LSNSQLAEIDASLQAIVRRAYDLGRDDALKKVIDALNSDAPCVERLALMGPSTTGSETEPQSVVGAEPAAAAPWWAWPVR